MGKRPVTSLMAETNSFACFSVISGSGIFTGFPSAPITGIPFSSFLMVLPLGSKSSDSNVLLSRAASFPTRPDVTEMQNSRMTIGREVLLAETGDSRVRGVTLTTECRSRRSDAAPHRHEFRIPENNLIERRVPLRVVSKAKDPIESLFLDLGEHSADQALLALTNAMHAEQRDMNAHEWICGALPGATLKPALAFGTVGELYRSFSRPAEFARLSRLRRH